MNRQMKRAQEKAERQQKQTGAERRAAATAKAKSSASQEKKKRVGVRQFLKEVRIELRKVDWPTGRELTTYTTVVLVTIVVMTAFVFAVDWVLAEFFLQALIEN